MTKDNPELEARLALLANETPDFEGGLRRLSGNDPFDAILNLVDETVIPAVLEITHGELVFLIEVSGRRICRLPGLIEDLTASDAETLADAARRIAEFADSAKGPLRTRELPSNASGIDPAQSVSIQAIADAAGRPLVDPNAPPIEQIRLRLGASLIAAVTLDGGVVGETFGEADLTTQLEQELADLTAVARKGDGPSLTLYEADAAKLAMRGVVVVGDSALVFSTEGISSARIVALYNKSVVD